ncbi:hypothetical protein Bpfe_003760 [Biomphalaria pfeifferi]|uniref:Uncharacterized protein n=1 Tax=Biomphalaria pfeifferi TaxID=112525 RepID=A0AAD8FJV8_BIOPF|nr:hypothetical protein Bpfe_003760 [Biomphalaria pfeifferi]
MIAFILHYVNTLAVRTAMTQDNKKGENAILFCTWTADDSEIPSELSVTLIVMFSDTLHHSKSWSILNLTKDSTADCGQDALSSSGKQTTFALALSFLLWKEILFL